MSGASGRKLSWLGSSTIKSRDTVCNGKLPQRPGVFGAEVNGRSTVKILTLTLAATAQTNTLLSTLETDVSCQ